MLGIFIALLVIIVLILVIEKLTASSDGDGCFSKALQFAFVALLIFIVLDSCSKKNPSSGTQSSSSNSSSSSRPSSQPSSAADVALVGSWENSQESFALSLNPDGAGWALTYTSNDLRVFSETGSIWRSNGSSISLARDSGTIHVIGVNGGEWSQPQPQGNYEFNYLVFQNGQLRLSSAGAEPVDLFRK